MRKPGTALALIVLAIAAALFVAGMALMAHHHNQGAIYKTPAKGAAGPG